MPWHRELAEDVVQQIGEPLEARRTIGAQTLAKGCEAGDVRHEHGEGGSSRKWRRPASDAFLEERWRGARAPDRSGLLTGCGPNDKVVSMIPPFQTDGLLPPGIHQATWAEVRERFGGSPRRTAMLDGLYLAAKNLASAGCPVLYLDGSFVTDKREPGDFDGVWQSKGVNASLVDPVLLCFDNGRALQKAKYRGELFPAEIVESQSRLTFLEFFQVCKNTGKPKGIIAIRIEGLS